MSGRLDETEQRQRRGEGKAAHQSSLLDAVQAHGERQRRFGRGPVGVVLQEEKADVVARRRRAPRRDARSKRSA